MGRAGAAGLGLRGRRGLRALPAPPDPSVLPGVPRHCPGERELLPWRAVTQCVTSRQLCYK